MLAVVDGVKVRTMRLNGDMTARALCREAGISESTLRKVERGGYVASTNTVWKIAAVFDVEASSLAYPVGSPELTVISGGVARARVA